MSHSTLADKLKVYGLLLVGLGFLTAGIFNIRDRISWNDPSDGIAWIERDEGVVVLTVTGEQPLPDVQPGDTLLRINQHEILNMGDYTDVLFLLNPGETAHYFLKDRSTGDVKEIRLTIQPKPVLAMKDFFRIIVAFVYLCVGVLILVKYWRSRGSIHFYLVCLFSFSLYLFSYINRLQPFDYLVYWISVISTLLLPPLFLHFSMNFPTRKSWLRTHSPVVLFIYLPFVFLLGLQIFWFAGRLAWIGLPRTLSARITLDIVHLIYFSLYFLGGLTLLFISRYSSESTELRQQMKWIVIGTTLSLVPFFFFYVLPFLLNLDINPLMQASILCLIFLPISFAYAIVKYRLMDVDILFKRGAAYFIASAAVLGIYFLLIGLSGVILQFFFPESNTFAIAVSALVVAFLFAPIRRRVQQEIDRFFYKDEYKYRQSLIEFGHTISTESSMETITSAIIERVNKSLKVETVAIFLRHPQEPEQYDLLAYRGLRRPLPARPYFTIPDAFLITGVNVPTLPFTIIEEESRPENLALRDEYARLSLFYFQPMAHRNETIGVIALGKGPQETFLSSEDLQLLGMIAGYAAIALENSRLYSSLQAKAHELEALKAYNENIVEGINVGVVAVSNDGLITTWNQAMVQLYYLPGRQAIGRRLEEVFAPDLSATIRNAFPADSYTTSDTANFYKLFLKNRRGDKRFVNLTVSPFVRETGQVAGTLLVFDDITARVQLETQLLQAEKLSSLGLIAAGVAHEVNTPLTGISSFTQMLIDETGQSHPHHTMLKKIESQCFRASEIVQNLLNFARVQTTDFGSVSLNELLQESVALLEHQFTKKTIAIRMDLAPDLPPVRGNEGQLMQVFVNILLNARDAVPPGGHIDIRSRFGDGFDVIQFEDNGKGIPPEIRQKIYDPFFTTKEVGQGTGLGLSVSYGIIQEHAGRIFVESEPGQGTRFTIKLPAAEPTAKEASSS